MVFKIIKRLDGYTFQLPYADNGSPLCPVCGFEWTEFNYGIYSIDGYPSLEICSGCKYQPGFDDDPTDTYEESWADWREMAT